MQIFIKTVQDSNGATELAMIELQGDLESKSQEPLAGKLVGSLHYSKEGTPIFIIGHHILFGKVVKLEKPFGVLEKISNEKGETEYIVKAIIHNKICFRERPKPIVSNIRKKL